MTAHHGFEFKNANVSGAFLPGRVQQAGRYMVPVSELADALGITRGKTGRLREACYGLVIAPKEWVESVYDGMKQMGLVQCKTDSCVRKLVGESSQGAQMQVLVLFHIADFMLAGRRGEAGWEDFQLRMHSKWKWSEWEQGHLCRTGVDVSWTTFNVTTVGKLMKSNRILKEMKSNLVEL